MMKHPHYRLSLLLLLLLSGLTVNAQQPAGDRPLNVGILLLNKPFITEFAGPLDVYHHVPKDKLRVFIVSDTNKEMVTYEGMPFRANYTIDNAPKIDVLVVPSGAGSLSDDPRNQRVIKWIQKVAGGAKFVTSHCEGAFLLGAAGWLDKREATTFHTDVAELKTRFPSCEVKGGRRIVVDGNLITSAGGLASYEAALFVVERLFGREQATKISEALVFGPSNLEEALQAQNPPAENPKRSCQ